MFHGLLCRTAVRRFGAGGTQGGVKRVSANAAYKYSRWMISERVRGLCADMHHPLVLEYFMRLNAKRDTVEKALNDGVGQQPDAAVAERVKNADGSPLELVRWNVMYRDELDLAEKVADVLKSLDEAVRMQEDVAKNSSPTQEEVELAAMAKEDEASNIEALAALESEVNEVMERRLDSADVMGSSSRTWILDVAGKAGGEEASLFAADLMEVYKAYANNIHNWRVTAPSDSNADDPAGDGNSAAAVDPSNGSGGSKLQIAGEHVYRFLHHEIGVHKVQRVPVTDQAGKMQTSTATVTLMPVLDPLNVDVRESDCKIEFVRGSGPGGQGMQSSSNCVCLLHKPTGISVKCHQSRSALGNKELALQMVAQQLLSMRVREQQSSLHSAWESQWNSGERSEKMRTYNYPQNRVTDHRLGKDFPLRSFMEGGQEMHSLHTELNNIEQQQELVTVLLKHIEGDFGSRL